MINTEGGAKAPPDYKTPAVWFPCFPSCPCKYIPPEGAVLLAQRGGFLYGQKEADYGKTESKA